ncbi:MAG: tyrosine-type recombinase/integrase family protein, partial [Clostridia bacterium]|nr:tyrosine-type recombinase/integrase family protein [Clostridia bacterium]
MVAGHLQEKKGLFYIVLSYQDVDNNRKTKWIPTNLPVKGNKKRAELMLWEAREKFKPPVGRGAMHSDMPFCEYLEEWLKIVKGSVRPATLASYASMVKFPIRPYFEKKHIALGDLKAVHIQKFYTDQLERVSPNSVIHYHAVIHKALKYAVKVELLNANPADRVELPKKEKFLSDYYDGDEINHLFELVEGTDLELPVKLAAFYGLRRSEVIGLRWCAVDFQKNTITIDHTVTAVEMDGRKVEMASDTTKTKSSLRT